MKVNYYLKKKKHDYVQYKVLSLQVCNIHELQGLQQLLLLLARKVYISYLRLERVEAWRCPELLSFDQINREGDRAQDLVQWHRLNVTTLMGGWWQTWSSMKLIYM